MVGKSPLHDRLVEKIDSDAAGVVRVTEGPPIDRTIAIELHPADIVSHSDALISQESSRNES